MPKPTWVLGSILRAGLITVGSATVVAGLAGVLGVRRLRRGDPPKSFVLEASDGGVLMEVTAIEFRGQDLALKGKMMGTMPTVARLRPAEAAKAIRLIPAELMKGLPGFVADVFGLAQREAPEV